MSSLSSPAELMAAKAMAEEDLYFFTRWMFLQRKGYKWRRARHHRLICDALMRVFRGECKRLIINIPPRYSKTEIAVVNFIAWCLGKVPDAEFIHASYSSILAVGNSSQIRELVQHEEYKRIFPDVELKGTAAYHWTTTKGGVMYATGTAGTITGYGAGKDRDGFGGAIIIDDPHKADEALSDVVRQGVLNWFQTTLESRKNSQNTPIIVIMQRLHEKDLAGWLEKGGNGEEWEVLNLSVWQKDENGKEVPLWPEKHGAEVLRVMERVAPYVFSGQYRQRPSPPEGGKFKPGKIEIIDALPAGIKKVWRGWDFASSVEQESDYTAGGKLGELPDGRYVIMDMVREQLGPDDRDALLKNTAIRDGKTVRQSIPQDPGQAGKTQVKYLTKQLSGYTVQSSPESGDKVVRAEPFAAQVNVGNVLMLRGSWNDALIEEMRMFPNGAHDDQIDCLSRAFEQMIGGRTGLLDFMKQQADKAMAAKAQQEEEASNG